MDYFSSCTGDRRRTCNRMWKVRWLRSWRKRYLFRRWRLSGEKMKKYILILLALLTSIPALAANPTQVLITLTALAVSTSQDCSNPIVVVDYGAAGREFDFATAPRLGGANVANGT